MAYQLNLNKLIKDLRGPKGLAALTDEVNKIRTEVERLTDSVPPTAQKQLKEIQVRLNGLKSNWSKRQAAFGKEIEKTLNQLKKAAKDAEARVEISLGRKPAKKAAKARGARTTKKAAGTTKKKASRSVKKA